jgi:hypothetical protein
MFRFAGKGGKAGVDVRVKFGGPFNAIILLDLAPSADKTWAAVVARRRDLKIPTVFPPASVPKVCTPTLVALQHAAISTATEPIHDHPTRRLQLRATSPYD